ncbi:MAG: hypothetical protein CL472_08245 [Acidobacteria bacterium]|nr:hypothetical protein [Acidobacteriota bacterium]
MAGQQEENGSVIRLTNVMIHDTNAGWLINGIAADGARRAFAFEPDFRANTDQALEKARGARAIAGEILIACKEAGEAGMTRKADMIRIGRDKDAFEMVSGSEMGAEFGSPRKQLAPLFDEFEKSGRQIDENARRERETSMEEQRRREAFESSRKGLSDMANQMEAVDLSALRNRSAGMEP